MQNLRGTVPMSEVWGGVLIGGASRRMGTPKQLLTIGGKTLLERAVAALAPHVAGIAILGGGPVPEACSHLPRLVDAELPGGGDAAGTPLPEGPSPAARGGAGPLAGLLAGLRWKPEAAWVFAPCDLPRIEPAAVAWLLAERRPDRDAVLARPEPDGPVHALFALYEPAARRLVEDLAAAGGRAPRLLAGLPRVAVVAPPPALARAWQGVNSPADLSGLDAG